MRYALILLVFAALGFALWVRFAPSDPARWHVSPPEEPRRFVGGIVEVIPGDEADFARLATLVETTQRTELLAGSPGERRMTFVTRSAFWGFPDYTTIAYANGRITIFARLRFGRSDLGVNAARVGGWIELLQAVDE